MGAHKDKIALAAPSSAGEPFLIFVAIGAELQDEEHRGKEFFMLNGDIGFEDTALELRTNLGDRTQDTIAGGVWKLFSFLFGGVG